MPGGRTIRYNGRNISVPADATDAEVAQILDASDGTSHQAAPAQQPGLMQRVWDFANKPMFHTHGLPQPNPDYRGGKGQTMTLPGEDTSESTTPVNAATQLLLAGQPESKLLRGGQRLLQGVLGASGGAHAVSEASEGRYGPAAIDAVGAAANTVGATKGLGREVRPLVGKAARVASDIVDPELTGVFSPRLGNAQRLLGRLADKIDKEAAPAAAEPAPMRQGPARKPLWADIPKETRPDPVAQYDQSADEASVNKLLDRKAANADVQNAKPARVPLWKQVQEPEGTPLPTEPESNIERARRRAPAPPPRSVGAAAAGFGEDNPRIISSARAEHESDQSLLAKLRNDLDAHGESAAAGVSKMGWMGNKADYDPVIPNGPNAEPGYQGAQGHFDLEGNPTYDPKTLLDQIEGKESEHTPFFHLTGGKNLASILQKGILPKAMAGDEPAVYVGDNPNMPRSELAIRQMSPTDFGAPPKAPIVLSGHLPQGIAEGFDPDPEWSELLGGFKDTPAENNGALVGYSPIGSHHISGLDVLGDNGETIASDDIRGRQGELLRKLRGKP